MALLIAYSELISLREAERKHAEVFHCRLAIDTNLQVANHLIEREVDLMFLVCADYEAELHGLISSVDQP